jgi:hypothetical protein
MEEGSPLKGEKQSADPLGIYARMPGVLQMVH